MPRYKGRDLLDVIREMGSFGRYRINDWYAGSFFYNKVPGVTTKDIGDALKNATRCDEDAMVASACRYTVRGNGLKLYCDILDGQDTIEVTGLDIDETT